MKQKIVKKNIIKNKEIKNENKKEKPIIFYFNNNQYEIPFACQC